MTQQNQPVTGKSAPGKLIDSMLNQVTQAVDQASVQLAQNRVQALREKHPEATQDQLADMLIKQKSIQTATVGAVTSGAAVIPGLGTLAAMTYGVAVDLGVTLKLQAELLNELAALHERDLEPGERRQVLLMVTGLNVGAEKLMATAGAKISAKAGERVASTTALKAIPVLGIAASAGANAVTTLVVGKRAHAYFALGPDAVGEWNQSLHALTGIDEQKVRARVATAGAASWQALRRGANNASSIAKARLAERRNQIESKTNGADNHAEPTSPTRAWLQRWRRPSTD